MRFGKQVPAVEATAVPADGYLLDVREIDEWQAGHAPDAVHIPLGELGGRVAEVPRDRDVYVICRSGARSGQAVRAFNGAGFAAMNVAGGMQAWAAADKPMISETGTDPYVA